MSWILHIVSGFILTAGMVDDLRSRKIHNHLILFFIPLALISVGVFKDFSSLLSMSLISGILALVIALPLRSLKVIGGGDVKLYFAVSLTWDWNMVVWSFIYALPISLVFGLLRILFQGNLKTFLTNMKFLFLFKKIDLQNAAVFPFSIALFLGWLTDLTLKTL